VQRRVTASSHPPGDTDGAGRRCAPRRRGRPARDARLPAGHASWPRGSRPADREQAGPAHQRRAGRPGVRAVGRPGPARRHRRLPAASSPPPIHHPYISCRSWQVPRRS